MVELVGKVWQTVPCVPIEPNAVGGPP